MNLNVKNANSLSHVSLVQCISVENITSIFRNLKNSKEIVIIKAFIWKNGEKSHCVILNQTPLNNVYCNTPGVVVAVIVLKKYELARYVSV